MKKNITAILTQEEGELFEQACKDRNISPQKVIKQIIDNYLKEDTISLTQEEKKQFEQACMDNNSNMTDELNKFMKYFSKNYDSKKHSNIDSFISEAVKDIKEKDNH